MTDALYHEPVLVEEVLAHWVADPAGRYLDGTVGGGGHADALLRRYPAATLIGLDRDPDALEEASRRLAPHADRVTLVHADLADLEAVFERHPGPPVVGILADLGVSSHQLDDPERGFSYQTEAPLRLVLDRDAEHGAADFLAEATEGELRTIFGELGELPAPGRIARAVVRGRTAAPILTTTDLVRVLRTAGVNSPRKLSQAFQALRFAVNDELGSLRRALAAATRVLPEGGRLVMISFESLMDRIVKQTFRPPRYERPHPAAPDPEPEWEVLTRKVVRPSPDEVARNPRSRSARLRAARRLAHAS